MSLIRPLEERDISQVASLYEFVVRSGSRQAPSALGGYFARTFLGDPWVDPRVPSLVYETTDGTIAGFIGSHVRWMRVDGERVLVGCGHGLFSDPALRHKAVGALLLRSYLGGAQDLTIFDGATAEVRQMWERLGGATALLLSLSWTRFFRPFRFAAGVMLERSRKQNWKPILFPVASVLDTVGARAGRRFLPVSEPSTRAEQLTPEALLEHLSAMAGRLRVSPDYDPEFLEWLFREMASVRSRGRLVRHLVRDQSGRALGWYVAYLQPGGVSQAIQIAGTGHDIEAVIDDLFYHAWRSGTAVLSGRLEPHLFEVVWKRHCYLRHSERVLVHSRNKDLVNAVVIGDGLLTRMEGEWWMVHHIEHFNEEN